MSHERHRAAAAAPSRTTEPPTSKSAPIMTSNRMIRGRAPISDQEIRVCAYRKWESAGRPNGDGVQFWLAAKEELEREQALAATTLEP